MSGSDTPKAAGGLDERIDAALGSWPMPDRGPAAWENLAARIDARVARGSGGTASDSEGDSPTGPAAVEPLLDPPLPATPPEVQQSAPLGKLNVEPVSRIAAASGESKMSQPPERGRDRRSLKDLAKLANSPSLTPTPPPSKAAPVSVSSLAAAAAATRRSDPGDSGIVDLKMMAQVDPEAGERAKDTKLASAALFDEEDHASASSPSSAKEKVPPASSVAPAAAASSRSSATAPASSRNAPAAAPARAASKADEGKGSSLVWIAGVGGLFAAAAAAVIMLQSSSSAPTADSPPSPPAVTTTVAPAAKPKAAPPAEPVAAADTAAPAKDPNEVDLASLPSASPSAKGAAAGARAVAVGPKKTVTLPGASAPEEKPAGPNPSLVANIPPMAAADKDALQNALRQAAGPTDNPAGGSTSPSTAAADPGSVPQKPSAGAIAGGVSSAMSQARSCLGLDDPISRAAVTFESSGAVQSVTISGFAAGKPAEACIKAALSRAKVPPFAQPIYTQSFTIRPNS